MSEQTPDQPTGAPPEQEQAPNGLDTPGDDGHPSGDEAVPDQGTAEGADDPFKPPVPAEDVVGDAE